ncbi:hypothetical protein FA95DRAFT_1566516 [Auriscalpium vulgare]|uniref:Uncharacterized protein n=1 Tax=Auriscalpium vulgare TaxID=40419 RepID=A0ACB8R8F6_9AGAM|nr:hypothetical protein FA95DRAFT_1566516 [Auriscalpium vulgare]
MQVPSRSGSAQHTVADAVRVAPYLTHVIRHHGQLTLIPPDNAGRVRKPKREKRPKAERTPRSNEEPQFNVGVPRASRRGPPSSPSSRGRPDRRRDESDAGVSIPDYPPPSFDEAISAGAGPRSALTAPSSLSLATPTALNPPPSPGGSELSAARDQPSPVTIPPLPARSRSRLAFAPSTTDPDPPSPSDPVRFSTQAEYNDSDSDDSLEIVSKSEATSSASQWEQDRLKGLSLRERLMREHEREHERQQGVKKKPSSASMLTMRPSPSQLTLTPSRFGEQEPLDDDVLPSSPSNESQNGDPFGSPCTTSPSLLPRNKKRLHLFPGRNKSKERQPLSLPSSPTFASSTLSLPLQFLNRPGSPNAKSASSPRSEGHVRKFFGHKGKEKSVDTLDKAPEPLEAWEILDESDDESLASPGGTPVAGPSKYFPRAGRLAQQPSESVPHLPAVGTGASSPHPSTRPKRHSMLERPVPPPPTAFLSKTEQRPPPPPPNSAAAPASPTRAHQVSFANQSPPSATTSPSSPRHHALQSPSPTTTISPSPISLQSGITYMDYEPGSPLTPVSAHTQLSNGVRRRVTTGAAAPRWSPTLASTVSSRRADEQDTIEGVIQSERTVASYHRGNPVAVSSSPTRAEFAVPSMRSRTFSPPPPLASPISIGDRRMGAPHQFSPPTPSPLANQSFDVEATPPATTAPLPAHDHFSGDRVSAVESLIDLYDHDPVPSNNVMPSSPVAESRIPGGRTPVSAGAGAHHYPGRPLPRPPGSTSPNAVRPVSVHFFVSGDGSDNGVSEKERRLLEEHSLRGGALMRIQSPPIQVSYAVDLPRSPPFDAQGMLQNPSPLALSPRHEASPVYVASQSPELSPSPFPPPSPASIFEQSAPTTPQSSTPPATHAYAEYTELDALLSRLDDGNASGENYESLLIVSDILGSAVPPRRSSPPVGRVEVARRRVTKDGRVKLKLTLLGVAVDRCAICQCQFKDKESAALGTACQHGFHERCLRSWLARNQTCPLCRAPFE